MRGRYGTRGTQFFQREIVKFLRATGPAEIPYCKGLTPPRTAAAFTRHTSPNELERR